MRTNQLKLYLIAYGAYRFLTEYIRPEPAYWHDLTFYQWVSVAMIAALSLQWIYDSLTLPPFPRVSSPTSSNKNHLPSPQVASENT